MMMFYVSGVSGLNIAGNKFDAYKCDANEAIQFRLGELQLHARL